MANTFPQASGWSGTQAPHFVIDENQKQQRSYLLDKGIGEMVSATQGLSAGKNYPTNRQILVYPQIASAILFYNQASASEYVSLFIQSGDTFNYKWDRRFFQPLEKSS